MALSMDIVVIGAFFIGMLAIGIYAAKKNKGPYGFCNRWAQHQTPAPGGDSCRDGNWCKFDHGRGEFGL